MRRILGILLASVATPVLAEGYDCLMDPSEIVELGSPVQGLLDAVLVDRGDVIEKGQVVAHLNSLVEQSTVDLLRTRANSTTVIDAQTEQLDMIKRRFERVERLRERGIATAEAFDQVEAEVIAAQSLLFQAELNQEIARKELVRAEVSLSLRTIRSPSAGVVLSRSLSAGEYVGSDDHLMTIVQLDPLKIEAFLPVALYGTITVGDEAIVSPAPPLSGSYLASVVSVDRVFDAASATFSAVLELPNSDQSLPAGHRCTLTVKGS